VSFAFPDLPADFLGGSGFCRNFFWVFKISTGKILGFLTFAPKFLAPGNFQPEFFWDFQLSSRKKFLKTRNTGTSIQAGLRRGRELVTELTPFFPTFAPTFFKIFNFQSKIFPAFQISR